MSETRELLRPAVHGFEPMPDAFEQVLRRRDRKQRNRRVAAGVLGIAVFALALFGLIRAIRTEPQPAVPEPPTANGNWIVISVMHLDPGHDAPSPGRSSDANLYVVGPDARAHLIAGSEGDKVAQGCPAFSPDGSLLAYGEGDGGSDAIVVNGFTSAGGLGPPHLRISVPRGDSFVGACPEWAPDGRRLATIAPGLGLLFADLDGATHLTRFDAYGLKEGIIDMQWSPDGTEVAVLMYGDNFGKQLWIVPADGHEARRLFELDRGSDQIGDDISAFAWTNDGRSIVVGGSSPGDLVNSIDPFLKVVEVATGEASDVPLPARWNGAGVTQLFSASDGRFLIERDRQALEWIDLQGDVTQTIPLRDPIDSTISLSPDGEQILYVTVGTEPLGPYGQALFAIPLDGGKPVRYSPWSNGFGDNYATWTWQPRPS